MDPEYFNSYVMSWGTLGTVRPFPGLNPEKDALAVQTALEKKDVVSLVSILTNRNSAQRQMVDKAYRGIGQKDLETGLKKVLSGDLLSLMLALMMTPYEHEAHRLRQAMEGLGTNEETLLEILCTRSAPQLKETNTAYSEIYKKDLEKDLKGETSGDFAKLIVALLHKDNVVGVVQRDIEALSASLDTKKTDPAIWINILTSRDAVHLQKVLMRVEMERGEPLDKTLEKRFSGDFRMGLKTLVQCIQSPHVFLAQRLVSMKTALVHGVMVSRCEEDLLCVRAAFLKLTGTSLYTTLQQKHFKGEHLQALLAICRSED
ncbi:annexin A2 isoform X1 [Gadus chalcogrammus]|uniref:annexin A2 isoform X1 n=1 Tax=Gadus chalcogrammus TaxID=1042646 RepID=UPI0024C4B0F4|nr:annexin A2 isoform X1 [Gadus chalcogrammus]